MVPISPVGVMVMLTKDGHAGPDLSTVKVNENGSDALPARSIVETNMVLVEPSGSDESADSGMVTIALLENT